MHSLQIWKSQCSLFFLKWSKSCTIMVKKWFWYLIIYHTYKIIWWFSWSKMLIITFVLPTSSSTIKNSHPHCFIPHFLFKSFLPHPHIINMILLTLNMLVRDENFIWSQISYLPTTLCIKSRNFHSFVFLILKCLRFLFYEI